MATPTTHLPTRMSYYSPVDYGERYHYVHPSLPGIPPSSYNPPAPGDKLYEVSIKVEEVKSSLHQAIDKTIARGEQLEETERRAQELENNSNRFYRGARNLKCMFCKKNARMIGCCLFALALVIFTIVMIAKSYSN
ncbi:MAG: synaptobrevin family protein [Candidatus Colwellbacteria bacterium]|nr:synaptobrevin family protein [Candidatus Colwellbacteria bacterium]